MKCAFFSSNQSIQNNSLRIRIIQLTSSNKFQFFLKYYLNLHTLNNYLKWLKQEKDIK